MPPTPGPLAIAENLHIDIGMMMLVGATVALPAAVVGLIVGTWIDRMMPIPMRPLSGGLEDQEKADPLQEHELPSLFASLMPVVLPVLLISSNTILKTYITTTFSAPPAEGTAIRRAADFAELVGNPNFALLISTVFAMILYARRRRPTRDAMARMVETSLMSAGVIILITAAGGAFGAMLKAAEIGPAIQELFGSEGRTTGLALLLLGFGISAVLKVAQGSSTVAMITTSGMLAAMLPEAPTVAEQAKLLGFHPVYLATAVGSGSLIGSWMNDSGFWIFTRMGGLTEAESLKSWTPTLVALGVTGLVVTVLMALALPLV